MSTKKIGAGVAAQNRAKGETQREVKPSMANLQACISDYAEEQNRHEAKMNELRKRWPDTEPDPEKMRDAAKGLIRKFHREQQRHYLFAMDILGRFRRRVNAEHCLQLVVERGLFCWFFIDEKGRWFMRRESGEWFPVKQKQVESAMQLFGVSPRKANSKDRLSEFKCALLWFDMNRIELTPAVRLSLLSGERLDVFEIRYRCSRKYIEQVKGMKAMNREVGTDDGGWF
jgi:hypothetical protein